MSSVRNVTSTTSALSRHLGTLSNPLIQVIQNEYGNHIDRRFFFDGAIAAARTGLQDFRTIFQGSGVSAVTGKFTYFRNGVEVHSGSRLLHDLIRQVKDDQLPLLLDYLSSQEEVDFESKEIIAQKTPLVLTVEYGKRITFDYLLAKKVKVDKNILCSSKFLSKVVDSETIEKYLSIFKTLIEEYHVNIDAQADESQYSALHRAARAARLPIINYLTSKGADLFLYNKDKMTAIGIAFAE